MSKKQIIVQEYEREIDSIDAKYDLFAKSISDTSLAILKKLLETCESEDDEKWIADSVESSRMILILNNEKERFRAVREYQATVEVWG